MIIGERIAALMSALGISQGELARRVKVSQPTIFKLIHENKTGSVHLHRIAVELQTTPAYLTGETDNPSLDAPPPTLSSEDQALLALYHSLESSGQKAVIEIMRTMAQAALAAPPASRSAKAPAKLVAARKAKAAPIEAIR